MKDPIWFTVPDVVPAEEETTSLKVPCMVFSRVVGFLTPVGQWNTGKAQEWADRKVFKLPTAQQLEARIKQVPPAVATKLDTFWLPDDWSHPD